MVLFLNINAGNRKESSDIFYILRKTPELFDKLHDHGQGKLTKQDALREPITSGERLAMTLW